MVARLEAHHERRLRVGRAHQAPTLREDGADTIDVDGLVSALEDFGRAADDICVYSDIDMMIDKTKGGYTRKDGTPY